MPQRGGTVSRRESRSSRNIANSLHSQPGVLVAQVAEPVLLLATGLIGFVVRAALFGNDMRIK